MHQALEQHKHSFKKYFIPHEHNNYHPHLLHTKRAIFYSLFFIGIKAIVVGAAILLPLPVFVFPDVLLPEQTRIITLTNQVRAERGRQPLAVVPKLDYSATLKSADMANHEYFSHISPDKHGLSYFLNSAHYPYKVAGENLAMGFSDADELVSAWIKSPTHYKNLIDADYVEFGVGMTAGYYEKAPTVYVAQHFGSPKVVPAPATNTIKTAVVSTTKTVAAAPKPVATATSTQVLSERIVNTVLPVTKVSSTVVAVVEAPVYDENASTVAWREDPNGLLVEPVVYVKGSVKSVYVSIEGVKVQLDPGITREDGFTAYSKQAILPLTVRQVFKVGLSPSVVITGTNGETLMAAAPWDHVVVVSPTPVERYLRAQESVPFVSGLNSFSIYIYLGFLIFFGIGGIVMMISAYRKHHPHVIVQTLALVGILAALIIS